MPFWKCVLIFEESYLPSHYYNGIIVYKFIEIRHSNIKVIITTNIATGVKCPTCNTSVEPHVLIKSFGDDFTFDTDANKFVQISSGYFYDPV